jgi:hypothetical protein
MHKSLPQEHFELGLLLVVLVLELEDLLWYFYSDRLILFLCS